jgi:diaminopropionate ammonia-lyase
MRVTDLAADAREIWPEYAATRLIELPGLARIASIGHVFVKAECDRPLGNFKVLGGMLAGLRALARAAGMTTLRELLSNPTQQSSLPRLICASDGNHGLAVAAAAARAGARASIYLPEGVSRIRANRIEAFGAEIVWVSGTYDDAVRNASAAAARGEGLLISDTSSDPNDAVAKEVMAGYGLITRELTAQFSTDARDGPTHVFVQAGVGGLAAAIAAGVKDLLGGPKRLLVVEPQAAACVASALSAGQPVHISGHLQTSAAMLSCGLASAPALTVLQRHRVSAIAVGEEQLEAAANAMLEAGGPATTASGAAGLAGLLQVAACPSLRAEHQLGAESRVLLIVTEGPLLQSNQH